MKSKIQLLLVLVFMVKLASAQTDFRPAWVINNEGDTLSGQVDYRLNLITDNRCQFMDDNGRVKTFSPQDIRAFRFVDGRYFESKPADEQLVFMEVLIKGKASIYLLSDREGDHFYIDKENEELREIPYKRGITEVNGQKMFYDTKRHVGILNYYLGDRPGFREKIARITKPAKNNLVPLVRAYNNELGGENEPISFENKEPLFKVDLELTGGVAQYEGFEDLIDKTYFVGGLAAHINMPGKSTKIFFKTGVLLSKLEFKTEEGYYLRIPIQLEYVYPKGTVRPRIAYGPYLYYPGYRTVGIDLGVNVKLNDSWFLSATSDVEFEQQMLILPQDIFGYSFQLGILHRF